MRHRLYLHTESHTISKAKDTAFTVFQSVKGHQKEHCGHHVIFNWTACISCCGFFPHLVNSCSSLSCRRCSRNRALGCFINFISVNSCCQQISPHLHPRYRMGPLPALPHLGVFTLQIPSACCHPFTSPKLANIEVAVKESKEVDGELYKMVSHMPPVKHLSSGGSSTHCCCCC